MTFVMIIYLIPLYIFIRPIVPAMISDLTSTTERSRGMGLVSISNTLSVLIGVLIGGYIADTYEVGMNIWTIIPASFGWIGFILALIFVKETLKLKNE